MMMTFPKRVTGIGDLINELTPQRLEETIFISPSALGHTLEKYKEFLYNPNHSRKLKVLAKDRSFVAIKDHTAMNKFLADVTNVLTPEEIKAFCQMVLVYEKEGLLYQELTPTFIDHLLSNSFQAGNNQFTLPPLESLARSLHGTDERKLELTLEGTADDVGQLSTNLSLTIRGDLYGTSCELAEKCRVVIFGDVHCPALALGSRQCTFEVHGSFGTKKHTTLLGEDNKDCTYIFHGPIYQPTGWIKNELLPNKCQFKTSLAENVPKLEHWLPRGNKLYFINPDQSEKIVRDYR